MIIPVVLNNEKTFLDASPSKSLLEVLREKNFFSVKEGCKMGLCGFCSVLVDGRAVPSCKIPAGILRDCEIVTLDYFMTTKDYEDIADGFEKAGVQLCGYCNASKIFSVHNLLQDYYKSDKEQLSQITKLADDLVCTCTEKKSFINGVLYAVSNRHKRENAVRERKES